MEKIRGEGSTIYSGVTVAFHVFTGPYILHDESFYIDHSRIISAEIIFADIVDLYIFDNLTNIVFFSAIHNFGLGMGMGKNSSNVQFDKYMMLRGYTYFCTNAEGKSIFKAEDIVEPAVVK